MVFTAVTQGTVLFVSDPADILPLNQVSLFGLSQSVDSSLIRYGSASIIVDSSGAQPDTATVLEDSTDNAIDVLGNDELMGQGPLMITSVSSPSSQGGTTSISGNQVLYTPAADFQGTDTFTYTTEDGDGNVSAAVVRVTVDECQRCSDSSR